MSFFSIIVPVYNVEDYLEECVNSVRNQTYQDIEIILVDDGSPDRCPEICDNFAKEDERIQVIHKKNEGLSSARNIGLEMASGEYILFLDSDDYWNEKNALNKLYNEILKLNFSADAVIYQAILEYPGKILKIDREGREFPDDFNALSPEEEISEMLKRDLIPGGSWIMALKRSFLMNNSLYFQKGIKSEDTEWMFRLLNCRPKFQFSNIRFYVYRKNRAGSITNTISYGHLIQYIKIVDESRKIKFLNERIKNEILSYAAYHLKIIMGLSGQLNDKSQTKDIRGKIKKLKLLFEYDLHPKARKVKKLVNIIGFNNACKVLSGYLKIRDIWRQQK